MKKNRKKYVWSGISGLLLSGSLFMTSCFAGEALAAEEVFQVLFPADTDHVFDFIMDPQELIHKTNAAAYGDLTFEEGATLFFRRHDGRAEEDYSSASDALVITNTGTEKVELTLSAGISSDSMEQIHLSDDETFADDTGAGLYLALTDGEHTVPIDREEGAVIHTTLEGISGEEETGREYRFWLVGAANRNGDWSEVDEAAPRVTVTWSAQSGEKEEPQAGAATENGEEMPETSAPQNNTPDKETPDSKENVTDKGTSEAGKDAVNTETPEAGKDAADTETPEAGKDTTGIETPNSGENVTDTKIPEPVTDTKPAEPEKNAAESETPESKMPEEKTEEGQTAEENQGEGQSEKEKSAGESNLPAGGVQ